MANTDQNTRQEHNDEFPGYPHYPASDDMYSRGFKEADIDPEDPTHQKESLAIETTETRNEKDFTDDISGSDLDIPGTELDDDMEANGSEDEENNHYSLGGDNHNDLEEDNG